MSIPERDYDPRLVSDKAQIAWTELYTQAHVAAVRGKKTPRKAAE
jgi:hypothetical protein